MRELGLPIPTKYILGLANVQDKEKLDEAVEAEEQQQAQAQQSQMQQQMAVLQAQIEDLQAKAVANQGLGVERMSRVQENRALAIERLSQAKENRQEANLAMAKTVKELQGIDITQVQQLLAIIEMLKEHSAADPAEAGPAAAEQNEEAQMPQAFDLSSP